MKNKKVLLSSLLVLPLILGGCSGQKASGLEIEFDAIVPTAYINEEYDFSDVLIVEKDVEYSLEVYYYDYYSKVEKSLEVTNDFYFTPVELFDLTVVVNAEKGNEKLSRSKTVPVSQKVDPIDELLASDGFSGWGDPGIIKEAVIDEQYFKGENSHSALSVHFQGSNPYPWGTTFLSLNNFRLLPYWADQTWENAVVHFWVYNPTDAELEFQMRVADNLTGLVNVDWGQALNVPRKAQPGVWTEVNFSLKHMGIDHTLYQNEEGTRDDSIIVKVKYGNTPSDGLNVYSYQFFVDDIDVIPYSAERFPDVDPKCYATAETIEYGWENMALDEGWSRANILFDREVVNSTEEHVSLSSMYLTFDGVKLGENDGANGYSVILNPQAEFGDDRLPSFRHGSLDFDIKYDNISDKTIKFVGVQYDWKPDVRLTVQPEAGENGWMHISFDFGEHSGFYYITRGIRLGICFPGVNDDNKATAAVHIDNIVFDQNGGTPEEDIPRGTGFSSGVGCTLSFSEIALTETIEVDFKFTSSSETKVAFMLGCGWLDYYGYFILFANGNFAEDYNGVSIKLLEDGYYRVTFKLSLLDRVGGGSKENITGIDLFYIRGEDWTDASGYVDFVSPALY